MKSEFRIFLSTGVSGDSAELRVCMNKRASERGIRGREEPPGGEEGGGGRCSYVHGDVPGHVDVGFVLVHPNLGGAQGISLGVVIDVVVVGLLGALDVCHPGAGEDLHAAATLPHLDRRGNDMHKETQLTPSSEN